MIKIIFMGSPEFSVKALEKLNDHPEIDVSLVISQKDKVRGRNKIIPTPVKKKAIELGLKTFEPDKINDTSSLDIIDKINPDFIVVIAYGQIIGDHLLKTYKDRIINIHSSLLPKYRGAAPMQAAILNNDEKTGVCSMLIEKSMDTGDILSCIEMAITDTTTIEDVHDTLADKASQLITDTLLNYESLYKNRVQQDESKATYTKKINKEMGKIDFTDKAINIDLKIRAFKGWPGTYAMLEGQNVKIHKISIINKYNNTKEGVIDKVDDSGIYVNCSDKCIIIKEIQFPNKRKMSVSDYLKGNTLKKGLKFS